MSRLIALQGPEAGRTYSLAPEATVLGRQHDSTICLLGRAISRHHARITRENDGWVIEDLDSSNGTFLNGEMINAAKLRHGDTVGVGDCKLEFIVEPTAAAPQP